MGSFISRALKALLLTTAVVLTPVTAARADIVYLYDDLNRLVRVIRDNGEAATYHYDAVGNILSITRASGVSQTTTVTSVSPTSAQAGSTTTVTISGSNLAGATVTVSTPCVTVQNLRTDADSLAFDLVVCADANLGSATLTITGALGASTVALDITPHPPTAGVRIVGTITPPVMAPSDLKLSPDGARAFVMDDNSVKVIDTATHRVVSTIPVSVSAEIGAITPNGTRLYVTGFDMTGVVDLVNNVEVTTIPVGGARLRGQMAITPDGKTIYLVVDFEDAVEVIDTTSNAVVTTVTVPGALSVVVSSDGRRVYVNGRVFDGGSNFNKTTTVIDPTTNTVAATIPGGPVGTTPYPDSTAFVGVFSPDSTRFYHAGQINVNVINTTTNTVNTIPNVGEVSALAINATGTRLYAATSGSQLAVIDTATNTVTATVTIPTGPVDMVLTPDGQRLVLVYSFGNNAPRDSVTVVDTVTNEVVASVLLNGENALFAAAIANRRVYVAMGDTGTVAVVDLTTNVALDVPISRTGAPVSSIVFAPNGGPAYGPAAFYPALNSPAFTVIASFDPATLEAGRNLSTPDGASYFRSLAVDPVNGGMLYAATPTLFYFLNPTTGAILATLPIPNDVVTNIFPSPDGRRVLLVTFDGNVAVVDTASRAQTAMLALGRSVSAAAVNRSGTRLYVGTSGAVLVVDTAGPTLLATVPLAGSPVLLALTADGSKLLALTDAQTSVIVINTTSNTVVATIYPGGSLTDLVTSPTTARAYIANRTNNRVEILDTIGNTIAGAMPLAAAPTHLGITPDGARLYVVQGPAQLLSVIDTHITATIGTVGIPGAFGSAGQVFVAPSGRAFVEQFDFQYPAALFVVE
ncbi:MAG: hypothetical protein AUI47_10715 [Acidobacteria bacterium 13_1_40CM_2_68_5]|nr:MAG: hypothetical protein AUI47_10715 [Acidobacteria bacterium 13_1_40CM_2_68_5]